MHHRLNLGSPAGTLSLCGGKCRMLNPPILGSILAGTIPLRGSVHPPPSSPPPRTSHPSPSRGGVSSASGPCVLMNQALCSRPAVCSGQHSTPARQIITSCGYILKNIIILIYMQRIYYKKHNYRK